MYKTRNKILCRLCMGTLDLTSSVRLSKRLSVGKSIEEILLFFIPDMVQSELVDYFACSDCVNTLQIFTKFIERCITVENYLREDSIHKNISKGTHTNQGIFIDISDGNAPKICDSVNKLPEIKKFQNQGGKLKNTGVIKCKLKKMSEISGRLVKLVPTLLQNTVVTAEIHPGEELDQSSGLNKNGYPMVVIPTEDLYTPLDVPDFGGTEITKFNIHPQIRNYSKRIAEKPKQPFGIIDNDKTAGDSVTKETGINLLETEDINIDVAATKETDLTYQQDDVVTGDNIDCEILDSNLLNTEPAEDVTYLNDFLEGSESITTFYCYPEHGDTILSSNRVISVKKTNKEVGDFMRLFSSSKVNLMKLDPLKETRSKRIIFVGNACKVSKKRVHPVCDTVVKTTCSQITDKLHKECPVCGEGCETEAGLNKHLYQAHKDYRRFQCEKCGKSFKRQRKFNEHLQDYELFQNCKLRRCNICRKKVLKDAYKTHADSHKPLHCNLCKKGFTTMFDLSKHSLSHQNVVKKKKRKCLCPVCGKFLGRASALSAHMEIHSESNNYLCDKCSKVFKTKMGLRCHIRSSHGAPREAIIYECSICKKTFKTKPGLKFHTQLKHSDVHPYNCHMCGKGFIQRYLYRKHLSVHVTNRRINYADRKPRQKYKIGVLFSCKYCDVKCKNVHILRMHLLKTHLKNQRPRCRFCNLTFVDHSTRTRHEKRHKDPETYELTCKVCWNRFDSKEQLEVHSAKHKGSQRYKCDECGEAFPSKYLIGHHKRDKHYNQALINKKRSAILEDGLSEFMV